jgi:hypothetical protein
LYGFDKQILYFSFTYRTYFLILFEAPIAEVNLSRYLHDHYVILMFFNDKVQRSILDSPVAFGKLNFSLFKKHYIQLINVRSGNKIR